MKLSLFRLTMVLTFIFFLSFVGLGSLCAADTEKLAAQEYAKGGYEQSAKLYEKLIADGHKSGAIYYNLANAYFRSGEKSQALLNYERAKRLLPRDADVDWNISLLKSTFKDKIDAPSQPIVIDFFNRYLSLVTTDELLVFVWATLIIHLLLSVLIFIIPSIRPALKPARLLLVILFAVSFLLWFHKQALSSQKSLIVFVPQIEARYGPSLRESKAFLLHEGAQGLMKDESGDWMFIELADKKSGWIPKKACRIV